MRTRLLSSAAAGGCKGEGECCRSAANPTQLAEMIGWASATLDPPNGVQARAYVVNDL